MADKLLADEIDYRPLAAAIVTQAINDLAHPDILIRLDAVLFFAQGDFNLFAEALKLKNDDGLDFLTSGNARRALDNAIREQERARVRERAANSRTRRKQRTA